MGKKRRKRSREEWNQTNQQSCTINRFFYLSLSFRESERDNRVHILIIIIRISYYNISYNYNYIDLCAHFSQILITVMFKKFCPIFIVYQLYTNGQYFLDIQITVVVV